MSRHAPNLPPSGPTRRQRLALALCAALLPLLFPRTRFKVFVGPTGRIHLDALPGRHAH